MNAHGQTPLALTLATAEIQIRVHLISRLVLFMSAQSSCIISGPRCHFSRIKAPDWILHGQLCPCKLTGCVHFVNKSHF